MIGADRREADAALPNRTVGTPCHEEGARIGFQVACPS
jgi:hypothetical protein